MTKIEVFDPPMCCSTGVCGPSPDATLARVAADLHWLASQGVVVERHSLSQEPQAFAASELVKGVLASEGNECLPLVLVDGRIASAGAYPSREELARLCGMRPPAAGLPVIQKRCCG